MINKSIVPNRRNKEAEKMPANSNLGLTGYSAFLFTYIFGTAQNNTAQNSHVRMEKIGN